MRRHLRDDERAMEEEDIGQIRVDLLLDRLSEARQRVSNLNEDRIKLHDVVICLRAELRRVEEQRDRARAAVLALRDMFEEGDGVAWLRDHANPLKTFDAAVADDPPVPR